MRDAMSGPLSRRATGIDRLLGLVLFASLVALIAGLILPAINMVFRVDYEVAERSVYFSNVLFLSFLEAQDVYDCIPEIQPSFREMRVLLVV